MSTPLRLATQDDIAAIDALMKASTRDLFPRVYDARQTASSVEHIAAVDPQLVDDGTYFVACEGADVIACGGWSRRDKLYTGSGATAGEARLLDPASEPARVRAMFVRADRTRRGLGTKIIEACEEAARAEGFSALALMATLPGLELYSRYGFAVVDHVDVTMPDGVSIVCAAMAMPLADR